MADVPAANGNNSVTESKPSPVKKFMQNPEVQKRIKEMLGARSTQFTTSVMSIISADTALAEAEPASLFAAALTAASLDLPINKNLGFAHIIAYKDNKKGITEAQMQIGWKGFVQLAQRSGQYKTISATEVYEGQIVSQDPLRGNVYDWSAKKSDKVVGYVSFFALVTGFEHELYMTVDEVKSHGMKYSQSYKRNYGPWKDNFDAMALKTVIKLNISKFGPMNTDLQKAVETDQAVIKDENTFDYIDAEVVDLPVAAIEAIEQATTKEDLQGIMNDLTVEQRKHAAPLITERMKEIG